MVGKAKAPDGAPPCDLGCSSWRFMMTVSVRKMTLISIWRAGRERVGQGLLFAPAFQIFEDRSGELVLQPAFIGKTQIDRLAVQLHE